MSRGCVQVQEALVPQVWNPGVAGVARRVDAAARRHPMEHERRHAPGRRQHAAAPRV
jgi:hypothetical protein